MVCGRKLRRGLSGTFAEVFCEHFERVHRGEHLLRAERRVGDGFRSAALCDEFYSARRANYRDCFAATGRVGVERYSFLARDVGDITPRYDAFLRLETSSNRN